MERLKVQAVCGFGVGSSTLLKIKLQKAFKDREVDAEVFTGDVTTATGAACDVIFTSRELYDNLASKVKVPVIVIESFVSNAEIGSKVDGFLESR